MNSKTTFVSTTDLETRNKLLKLGFQEIENSNNKYTFINTKTLKFEDDSIDKSKLQYTNMLCI